MCYTVFYIIYMYMYICMYICNMLGFAKTAGTFIHLMFFPEKIDSLIRAVYFLREKRGERVGPHIFQNWFLEVGIFGE